MLGGKYEVHGYNDKEKMVARVVANTIDEIKRAVTDMYFNADVKRISVQSPVEALMKTKEGVDLVEKIIGELIDTLNRRTKEFIDTIKTTNKELSKICNAICMK